MKSYNEMARDVLHRRDEYNSKKSKRAKKMRLTIIPAASLCLAALIGAGVFYGEAFDLKPPQIAEDAIIPGTPDYIDPPGTSCDSQSSVNEAPTVDGTDKHLFNVNEITGEIAGARRYLDPEKHYAKNYSAKDTAEYFGIDLTTLERLIGKNIAYCGGDSFTFTYENGGTLVEDYAAFIYRDNGNSEAIILASRISSPYDTVYQLESNNYTSFNTEGGTVSVLVGSADKSDSNSSYDFYFADFEYNGVKFRIKTKNITPYYLNAIIREILK